ncbi:cytochrome o ubiquinol oxidase subunit III [Vibrio sinus]|uniref:cytochrome o ubiquinol oxidase subunit III n=1 Tax=Vibrio sinus TaxID=2946865 RepID=UPI003D6FE1CB
MQTEAMTHAHDHHHDHHADEIKKNKLFGFWIYLMSDCVLFATLFATFAVLVGATAGGPDGKDLFEIPYVFVETMLLLFSSITFGFGMIAMRRKNIGALKFWMIVTFILGAGFIGMEINEFHHMILAGNGPERSAFLSAFFTLVGTHGLHVTFGLIWMATCYWQLNTKGLNDMMETRFACLSLFWHFLDIVWVCVFSIVYLMGVM